MAAFRWHGDEFLKMTRRELEKRLATVGAAVQGEVVRNFNTSGRTMKAAAKWGVRGPQRSRERLLVGKNKRVYIWRSKPGEVPHVQTGMLKKSIFWDIRPDRQSVIIGTPLKYGRALEQGTEDMAPRPFLLPALAARLPLIQKIMTRKLPGG